MSFQNIENKSIAYSLLKFWAKLWHNKVFYKKVIVVNPENIPSEGHLIFTPNHQNALMDALGPLFTIPRLLVFLARADIFGKPWLAKFLYFLKILPVFRIRDGYDSLKKNDTIFQKTVDVINAGDGLVILPEGTHAGFHKLRELKKGFARIAFKTEEENNFSMDIQIVPIGLYYSDYESFRSILLVNFGKPIAVSEYYNLYKSNPAIAIAKIKDDLRDAIKSLMIDIESDEYYFLYNQIRQYRAAQLKLEKKTEAQQFQAQQEIITQLEKVEKSNPEKMNSLNQLVHDFEKELKNSKLDFETIAGEKHQFFKTFASFFMLVAGLPVFIYGYLNNFLPWQITASLAGKIKDPQFRSSVKYLLSLLLFPFFYILQIIIFYNLISEKWVALAYLISLPFSAGFSWAYFHFLKKTNKSWNLYRLKSTKPLDYKRLTNFYKRITSEISELLSK
jgi:1-acyl-sn-glycerol-3-phosphate acyltransferase